jgi:hypothetical protein
MTTEAEILTHDFSDIVRLSLCMYDIARRQSKPEDEEEFSWAEMVEKCKIIRAYPVKTDTHYI